jgi:uncharacterized membrane protein
MLYPSIKLGLSSSNLEWLHEFLFWLHIILIVGAAIAGWWLPWQIVVAMVVMHRLHLKIFGGCALSRLQIYLGGLEPGRNFLQQAVERFWGRHISSDAARCIDIGIVSISVVIALTHYSTDWRPSLAHLVLALALCGAGFSYQAYRASQTKICQLNGSCQSNFDSPYATLFGLPVSLLGVVYFLLISSLATFQLAHAEVAGYLMVAVTLGLVASLGFIYLQANVLKQLCQSCMSVHAVSITMSSLLFLAI